MNSNVAMRTTKEEENKMLEKEIERLERNSHMFGRKILYGNLPRQEKVELAKPDIQNGGNFQGSVAVAELRKFVKSLYEQVKKKGRNDILVSVVANDFNSYVEDIKEFVSRNGEYNECPEQCVFKKPYSELQYVPCNGLIGIVQIRGYERIPVLNGQNGLEALQVIPSATVLIQYCGIHYLSSEFEEIYAGTNESTARNRYAYEYILNDPYLTQELEKTNWIVNGINYLPYICYKTDCGIDKKSKLYGHIHLVIDGIGSSPSYNVTNLWGLFNDCRKNLLNDEEPTPDDLVYENCEFVE
ncbi:hypothetical protein RFI_13997, partial [Reticulomyxa filosa]